MSPFLMAAEPPLAQLFHTLGSLPGTCTYKLQAWWRPEARWLRRLSLFTELPGYHSPRSEVPMPSAAASSHLCLFLLPDCPLHVFLPAFLPSLLPLAQLQSLFSCRTQAPSRAVQVYAFAGKCGQVYHISLDEQ